METFIFVAMLYFLITGILMIGMTVVGEHQNHERHMFHLYMVVLRKQSGLYTALHSGRR